MSAKKVPGLKKDSDAVHGQTVTPPSHPTTSHASASARARLASLASHLLPSSAKEQIFDYVIVGGGSEYRLFFDLSLWFPKLTELFSPSPVAAGAVIANRLTEDRDVSVAVIEGGPSDIGEDR